MEDLINRILELAEENTVLWHQIYEVDKLLTEEEMKTLCYARAGGYDPHGISASVNSADIRRILHIEAGDRSKEMLNLIKTDIQIRKGEETK